MEHPLLRMLVRNGFLPERAIQTGIGPVPVRRPRVRDRAAGGRQGRIRLASKVLPRHLRRTRSLEALLPWLYLKGISSGGFGEALEALLGPEAKGLSAATIGRLKAAWEGEHEAWQGRDLSGKRYVYFPSPSAAGARRAAGASAGAAAGSTACASTPASTRSRSAS